MTRRRTLEVMTALERQMPDRQPLRGILFRSVRPADARVPLEQQWPTYRETGHRRGR